MLLDARLQLDHDSLYTSFDLTNAFSEGFRRRVSGGLTSRVLFEVTLYDAHQHPLVSGIRECQLRMDIWDDVLDVQIRDNLTPAEHLRFLVIDQGLKACGRVRRFDLLDVSGSPPAGGYRLEIAVALNPVSPELLQHTREFMSNPRGTQPGRPQSLLGAVTRLFTSEQRAGGEVYLFRTRPLGRPLPARTGVAR